MRFFSQNKKIEFLGHIAIWLGYSFLVFSGPLFSDDFSIMALQMTIRTLIVNSILFYLNTFILLPNLVGKNKYLLYILSIAAIIITTLVILQLTDNHIRPEMNRGLTEMRINDGPPPDGYMNGEVPPLQPDEARKIGHMREKGFFKGPNFFFGLMSSLGILFISTIFWIIAESKKRHQRELALVNETLVTEMKFLKSQINPHFLFNALNNVYALTLTNSNKGPEMLLKLSDMLRFVLYESEDRKVVIGKEIDYILHFIDFQKIKIEGEPRIFLSIENVDRTMLIEPMLLIPFIENAFKHTRIEDTKRSWMRIELSSSQQTLYFKVENSLPATTMSVDKVGGIGIENVKKRLNFLYPHKHVLNITQTESEFRVEMSIITS